MKASFRSLFPRARRPLALFVKPLALLAVALSGCSLQPSNDAAAGEANGKTANGATVTSDGIGTPRLATPVGTCSSTLLGNHWLLTAHHCVTNGALIIGGTAVSPGSVTATLLGGASATGVAIFRHPTLDVALIELATSLDNPVNGLPYATPLFQLPASGLVGSTVYCQGWGNNGFVGGVVALRSANLPIIQMDGPSYRLSTNSLGQVDWKGDSGSSCFAVSGNARSILGVQSTCNFEGSTAIFCDQVAVESFREWAATIMRAPSAPRSGVR